MRKHNVSITILEILLVVMLTFTIITSIFINPAVMTDIVIQIDSPLETYTFNSSMNFSRIIIASTYVVFNDTGFNITATQTVDISIIDIDNDILEATYDELVVEFHTYSTESIIINLSGLLPNLQYNVHKDNVSDSTPTANSSGMILFETSSGYHNFKIYTIDDSTPPTVTINFAGNLSDSGGSYWRPPGESTALAGVWSDGYYTNDSRQSESWIYINLTVEDYGGVSNVWLQWLNETTWTNYTYAFTNMTGAYFEYNTSIRTEEEYNYSFNIEANDTIGNTKLVWWNKTGIAGDITRRRVQLNCTQNNFSYSPLYLYITDADATDVTKKDRMHHDQGIDGSQYDAGYLLPDTPDGTKQFIYCSSFIGAFVDNSSCVIQQNLNNIYFHIWLSSNDQDFDEVGWKKTRDNANATGLNESFQTDISQSKSRITVDNGIGAFSNSYWLEAKKLTTTPTLITDNDFYEIYITAVSTAFPGPNPSIISNRSFTVFVLFNVPDNTTLNTSHADTDSDLLSDWTELYVTYTNPFLVDTDNDSLDDYWENQNGSDPNNYTEYNFLPTQSGESPTNESTDIEVVPSLYVVCTDDDSDTMTATWRSNSSSDWVDFATNTSISTSTNITQRNYNFSSSSTTYWWSINITDGYGWSNATYHFTTSSGCAGVSTIQIDNPLETYTFAGSICLYTVTIEDTYVVFNTTGFNVTPSNPITIMITDIDDDIFNPDPTTENLVVFQVNNTPGETWFNISGFEPTLSYTILINDAFSTTDIANSTGVVSFSDNPSASDEYRIHWTAGVNTPPTVNNPVPANGSVDVSVSPTCSVDISDADSNPMSGSFYTNDSGEWLPFANFTDEPDGTISNASTGHFTTDYTKYWWCVNITDNVVWINNTYHFTTTGAGIPEVRTNAATNVEARNVTLNGELLNDGGEECWVSFEWGSNLNPFVNQTDNQTGITTGTSFSDSIVGSNVSWYDTSWIYRKKITISSAYVSTVIYDFPLLINHTDSTFSSARNDGYDFLFTDSEGTLLSYERELYDSSTNNIVAWVKVPNIASSDNTDLWLYWSNPDSIDQSNPTDVWSANYSAVYHLDEESGSTIYDSTNNHYNANYSGNLPTRNRTGIGYSQYFDGSSYIEFPAQLYARIMEDKGGYMAYVNVPEGGQEFFFYTLDTTETNRHYIRKYEVSTIFYAEENGTTTWDLTQLDTDAWNKWNYLGAWWDAANVDVIFTDEGQDDFSQEDQTILAGHPGGDYKRFWFGQNAKEGDMYLTSAHVDEIRIYDNTITQEWVEIDTHNILQTSGFLEYSSPQTKFSTAGDIAAGHLYFYRTVANNSVGSTDGDVVNFLTKPYEPYLFAALTENQDEINLTWIQITNSGYNLTYIERINGTTSPWVRGAGTEIYNGTLFYYLDSNLNWGTTYSYQAWSFTNWTDNSTTLYQYSASFNDAQNTTNTLPAFSNIIPANNTINDWDTNISLYITDPDGDTFNYTIELDPRYNLAGEFVGNSSEHDESNGTKTLVINGSHNQTYTWYVNATDDMDWNNESFNFTHQVTYVDIPTNGDGHFHETVQYLYLSWTGNPRSDTYVVVQRNDTYTTDVNQSSNWIRQNSSNLFYNVSWTETSGGYFTVFAFNNTATMYSYDWDNITGIDIPWGALSINVYNESNSSEGIEFDIEISDSSGENVYFAFDQTNTLYLDLNDIPFGDNTIFFITADGYESRTSYYDIAINNFYSLNFWLPPYTTPSDPGGGDPGGGDPGGDEGGNFTTTRQYRFRVVDEYAYPIANATVQIRRYMNATGKYENMSILLTDGYGEADLNLVPSEHYRAYVSKIDYESGIFDWIPDPVFFGANYPKIFQIIRTTTSEEIFTFWDLIQFNATLHTNGSLFVNYIDHNSNTTDAQFYIYEHYNFSRTFIETVSTTSNTFSFWINDLNFSREHEITIYLNHTVLDFVIKSITVGPVSDAAYDEGEIETKISNAIGPFSLGYVQTFFVYLPIMVFLVLPGPKHPGFAIIMASVYAGWASSFIVVGSILMIVPFAVAIGMVLMAVKGGMLKL